MDIDPLGETEEGPISRGKLNDVIANQKGLTSIGDRPVLTGFPGMTTPGIAAPEVTEPAWLEAQVDAFGKPVSGTRHYGGHYDSGRASPYPDLVHIGVIGQSLSTAADTSQITDGADPWGGLSFGGGAYGFLTWLYGSNPGTPGARQDDQLDIVDMTGYLSAFAEGESIARGVVAGVKARVSSVFAPGDQSETRPAILMSNACEGNRHLTEIGPEDSSTDVENGGSRGPGGYYKTHIDDLRRAYGWATNSAQSFGVVTIFMQGEQEAGERKLYAYDASPYAYDDLVSGYRDKLIGLADGLDADIAFNTGRMRRAPFITYQTADTVIGEAQLQAVEQGADMFMASPVYQLPSAINTKLGASGSQTWGSYLHIAADGERWLGEQFAKVIHRVVAEAEAWRPLSRRKVVRIDATTIDLHLDVPVGAIVIDTDFLAKAQGWGFEVWSDDPDARIAGTATRIVPNTIELRPGNVLRLGLPSSIATGTWYLRYGGVTQCDLGVTLPVASVRDGPNTTDGFATKELVLNANRLAALAPLTREGAFRVWRGAVSMTVRSAYNEGGVTVLRGEAREIAGGAMSAGTLAVHRWRGYGNIRDSDRALAVYSWSDEPYHQRNGRYPLWNWLVAFDNLEIA